MMHVRGYTVSGALGDSLRVWARNLVPIAVLGVLFYSPLIAFTAHTVGEVDGPSGLDMWWVLLTLFIAYAADQFLAAPIVYGVVQELNGTRAGVGACIAQGVKRFFPVFFTIFLLYWCVILGAYPFIIPGFVLATGLYVAVPAAVCERPGVLGTLTRSFELTEGNRFRIFGLFILFWGTRIGAKAILLQIFTPATSATDAQAFLIASLAVDFLYSTIGAVLQGVTYSRLRQLKDGVSTADLAKVFE